MKKEMLLDVDLEFLQTLLQLMHKFYVSFLMFIYSIFIAYERLVCRAPADYTLIAPSTFPEDVPFSIALTNDEYDPWTETSHKFRFYE